ncbi:MAG: hypothetical protein WBM13_13845 [Bacteroidia bacterium]
MISERTKYQAETQSVTISTANPNRNGTGTITPIITGAGPQDYGTIIKRIIIKATGNTTSGMIRFYLDSGGTPLLFTETPVTAVTKSASDHSFSAVLDINLLLALDNTLSVSTENAETFIVTVEGLGFYF